MYRTNGAAAARLENLNGVEVLLDGPGGVYLRVTVDHGSEPWILR